MQTPPIVCRRAAHILDCNRPHHIWISDDLLSHTIRQFFRSPCPHQKRHGSHVPGPLEARRRAAKRRMTAQAHLPQGAHFPPPLFNFGALFGANTEPRTSWKYQPPSFPPPRHIPVSSSEFPLGPPLDRDQLVDVPIEAETEQHGARNPENLEESTIDDSENQVENSSRPIPSGDHAQAPTISKPANVSSRPVITINILETKKHAQSVRHEQKHYTRQVRRFIASTLPLHDSEAFSQILENYLHAKSRKITADAHEFSLVVFLECLGASMPISDLLPIFNQSSIPCPSVSSARFTELLRHLERTGAEVLGHVAPRLLNQFAAQAMQEKTNVQPDVFSRLFSLIWEACESQSSSYRKDTYGSLRLMTKGIDNPFVKQVLGELIEDDKNIITSITKSIQPHRRSKECMHALSQVLNCIPRRYLTTWAKLELGSIQQRYVPNLRSPRVHFFRHFDNWLELLCALDMRAVFPTHSRALSSLAEESITTYTLRRSTMDSMLGGLNLRRQFQHIVDRAENDHCMPSKFRQPSSLLISSDGPLIHQLAYQYSLDMTRTHRRTWRSVYFMYRYLKANRYPIGPLFSRAVVRIGITQPLSQNEFVSLRRMAWVCQLVSSVEGPAVAKRLEDTFWVWRGQLIQHSAQRLQDTRGQGKVSVRNMKKLGLI